MESESLASFGSPLMTFSTNPLNTRERISQLFGLYRAEWMDGNLFDLYTEPAYFSELQSKRPCVLIGGRGTGKTTVLRGLSYQGQFTLSGGRIEHFKSLDYIGLYHRIDTNKVRAFLGPEATEVQWVRYFAHYMNLQICSSMLGFARWYELHANERVHLNDRSLSRVTASLGIPKVSGIADLEDQVGQILIKFEAAINNIGDDTPTNLSMQKAPIDLLADALIELPVLSGKKFFFLIDEYENLLDYQQKVINTIIKHSQPNYTFKIGVRELGWRTRETLNSHEQLGHPADYARIDITEELSGQRFDEFASRVCNDRLAKATDSDKCDSPSTLEIGDLLPGLSIDDEAALLGASSENQAFLASVASHADPQDVQFAATLSHGWVTLLRYWSDAGHGSPAEVVKDARSNADSWSHRWNNYAYASLFTIRRGKGGVRKYYAGWDVFLLLAGGNIRYLLELVQQSFLRHFDKKDILSPVDPRAQTVAAQQVGKKYLAELEGVTVEGARLTKLLLGLGRIFQLMAENPEKRSPETNQFCILEDQSESPDTREGLERLLRLGVMHLALVRSSGTKQLDEGDTREYDYMMHPIYAPFFVFSHRRKRKLPVTSTHLLALVDRPKDTIKAILGNQSGLAQEQLPEQLSLFQEYYDAGQ